MQKIKFGVLSVSNHLIKRIILPLQNLENCELYAIASRDKEKAQMAADDFSIPVVADSYEELIARTDIDAIYIPLPNHLHAEWAIKALKAGKPVLCEKPIAMDAAETRKMIEAADETKVPLMEAFMYKFHPMWRHVRDIIRTNQIGTLSFIHTTFSYNNPSPFNIRNIAEYGGGGLMDIGCYAISAARFLSSSEPKRVISLIAYDDDNGTDIHSSALMDFGHLRASFHVSTRSEPFQKVDIIGSAGSITIHVPFNTYVDTRALVTVSTGQGSRDVYFPIADAYGIMFREFSEALINKAPMPLPLSDALNNMLVIDAIRESTRSRTWVELNTKETSNVQ